MPSFAVIVSTVLKLFNFKVKSPGFNRQKYYSQKNCIAFSYDITGYILYVIVFIWPLVSIGLYPELCAYDIFHNYSTSARWICAKRQVGYNDLIQATSASGINVLLNTLTKYREFFPTLFVKTTDF